MRQFHSLVVQLVQGVFRASLTLEPHHSLRAFSLAVFALLLSAFGMNALSARPRKLLASIALIALAANGLLYVRHYFTQYPQESASAFENFGFQEALEVAAARAKGKVVLSEDSHRPLTNLQFFTPLVPNPRGVMLMVGDSSDVKPGNVFIEHDPFGRVAGPEVRAGLPKGTQFVLLRDRQLEKLARRQAALEKRAAISGDS